MSKSQRIIACYILYQLYTVEKVQSTPFEAVVLSSFQTCLMHVNTATNQVGEENQFKAEFRLLTDFFVSTPKMSKQQVIQYIQEMEASKEPIELAIPDIKHYIQIYQEKMPKLTGLRAVSVNGILQDQDDEEEFSPPELGIPLD